MTRPARDIAADAGIVASHSEPLLTCTFAGEADDGNRTCMVSLEDRAAIKVLTSANADLRVLGGRWHE